MFSDFFFDNGIFSAKLLPGPKDKDLVFGEAQVLALNITDLFDDGGGHDDKKNGCGELGDDKGLSKAAFGRSRAMDAAQNAARLEG